MCFGLANDGVHDPVTSRLAGTHPEIPACIALDLLDRLASVRGEELPIGHSPEVAAPLQRLPGRASAHNRS
jgi:hypothetical protein